jgi:hypothetical protein
VTCIVVQIFLFRTCIFKHARILRLGFCPDQNWRRLWMDRRKCSLKELQSVGQMLSDSLSAQ